MYVWREVSVDGDIYSLRETRSSTKRGELVADETNQLQVKVYLIFEFFQIKCSIMLCKEKLYDGLIIIGHLFIKNSFRMERWLTCVERLYSGGQRLASGRVRLEASWSGDWTSWMPENHSVRSTWTRW